MLAVKVTGVPTKALREMADQFRDKLQSGVVILGCENEGKASLLVCVTKDLSQKIHAGQIIKVLAEKIGGKGGGRPDFAQAGGNQPAQLDAALGQAADLVASFAKSS